MKNIKNLKKNSFYLVFLFLIGCATSSYRISNTDIEADETMGKYELMVTPDRIILECENLQTEDIVSYGFMIHILDEEKTVLTAAQPNRIGKSGCDKATKIINKILKKGTNIYIAGMANLSKPRKIRNPSYFFPGHGTFYDNGRFFEFHAIANEHGDCFDALHGEKQPCPGREFPISKPKF